MHKKKSTIQKIVTFAAVLNLKKWNMNYDLIVIGGGPGGYAAAIRASQLGLKTALIEREHLGGICLNWGCIPTKSLLKSAQVYRYIKHSADYGIDMELAASPNYGAIIARSRAVAENMSKGIQFLLKKNKIDVIWGNGTVANGTVNVLDSNGLQTSFATKNIIIATGARARQLSNLPIDGVKVIGYRQALSMHEQPKSMVVVGSGAIGCELAFFYQSIGTQVTLVEFMPQIIPLEDEESARQLERSFKKLGMKVMTKSTVEAVDTSGANCTVSIKTAKGVESIEADVVLSAVGISPNIENIGLEEINIKTEKGKIVVDEKYQTCVNGIYAIGDVIDSPALAHVASAEAIQCVENIAGIQSKSIDYKNIPSCIYTTPEVSSVGLTEKSAKEAGYNVKTGKFMFTASGKAWSAGEKDGFVKLVFDADTDKLLGASMVGQNVTEMIAQLVLMRNLDATAHELIKSIQPHPTMSEAVMEAAAAAYGEAIHV
jgi:dihydrolipoamide dehydrogenase